MCGEVTAVFLSPCLRGCQLRDFESAGDGQSRGTVPAHLAFWSIGYRNLCVRKKLRLCTSLVNGQSPPRMTTRGNEELIAHNTAQIQRGSASRCEPSPLPPSVTPVTLTLRRSHCTGGRCRGLTADRQVLAVCYKVTADAESPNTAALLSEERQGEVPRASFRSQGFITSSGRPPVCGTFHSRTPPWCVSATL